MKKTLLLLLAAVLLQPVSFGKELRTLPLNEISADGWMLNQMKRDITSGYISAYDKMQPSMRLDAFGPVKARNDKGAKVDNWETTMASWWAGEHEGYFADDVVRNAFLTGDKAWKAKADSIVSHILSYQEADGYIGIYEKDCRLDKLINDNGELWTQSRIMVALLAYYEYTGDKKVFKAVKKAVDLTVDAFVTSGKSYFQHPKQSGGGLTHGLMYFDVLEKMYSLTGDEKYADFAEWLYLDFSKATNMKQIDMQLGLLLDRDRLYESHSVHVVEHMRALLFLAAVKGNPEYRKAVDNMMYKYACSQAPSGVVVMDPTIHESVSRNYGSPYLPYEYCSIVETVISYSSAMQKYCDAGFADHVEWAAFNAGQGARLPDGTAISYSTIDNRREAVTGNNFRNQVAACHKVACCNLQAPKLIPYYVANMWMKDQESTELYAMLYGSSSVSTKLNGKDVTVRETTMYPFENQAQFEISVKKPVRFTLVFRNPGWSGKTEVVSDGAEVQYTDDGFIRVSKEWSDGDKVSIAFDDSIRVRKFMNNEVYFSKGALLYAMDIPNEKIATMTFKEGFSNYDVIPSDEAEAHRIFDELRVPGNIDIKYSKDTSLYSYEPNPAADDSYPFDVPYGFIKGHFVLNGKVSNCTLVPLGSTVLRRVTFRENDR